MRLKSEYLYLKIYEKGRGDEVLKERKIGCIMWSNYGQHDNEKIYIVFII